MKYLICCLFLSLSAFATDVVRVTDFNCGPQYQDDCFRDAVLHANTVKLPVYVPVRDYNLTMNTLIPKAGWRVPAYANFISPANYITGNDNLSYLQGVVVQVDSQTESGLHVGSTDWFPYTAIRHSAIPNAMVNAVSPYGKTGIASYTRTGSKDYLSEGTIGIKAYVLNDNEEHSGVAYGRYTEVIKWPGAGATFADETNLTCYGSLSRIWPSSSVGNQSNVCVNFWIGGPVGSGPLNDQYEKSPSSAGIVFAGGSAKDETGGNIGLDTGIIFPQKTFRNAYRNQIIRTYRGSCVGWYGGGATMLTELCGNETNGNGSFSFSSFTNGVQYQFLFDKLGFRTLNNSVNLGAPTRPWNAVYSKNGYYTTSDKRDKENIRRLNRKEAVLDRNLSQLLRVANLKGDSRKKFTVIAQDVIKAFEDAGLDWREYDMVREENGKYTVDYIQLLLLTGS